MVAFDACKTQELTESRERGSSILECSEVLSASKMPKLVLSSPKAGATSLAALIEERSSES